MLPVNGTMLWYTTIGSGIPLVAVHGGPGLNHHYFLPTMNRLADRFRIVLYDQRASGQSALDVDTLTMTMDYFVEDLEGTRKALKLDKMNLLGHSWGGLISMFYAIKYPDNLNSLILISSTPASEKLRDSSFQMMESLVSREDSMATYTLMQNPGFARRDPKVMTEFFRLLFRGTFYDRRLADSLDFGLDSTLQQRSLILKHLEKDPQLRSYDLLSRLGIVRCPTLIIAGDHDMIPAIANTALHRSITGSELVTLEHCGHFPFIEQPGIFFPLISDFLRRANP
jgi:proline iminopeptidase